MEKVNILNRYRIGIDCNDRPNCRLGYDAISLYATILHRWISSGSSFGPINIFLVDELELIEPETGNLNGSHFANIIRAIQRD